MDDNTRFWANLTRQLLACVREIPAYFYDRIDEFIQWGHQHRSDGSCSGHWRRTEWPCADLIEAYKRRCARRDAREVTQ